MEKLRNIIYIHTHDTGRYIQPYGYQVSTPNLMELAQQGTIFRKAFSAAPTCSPSRIGLLTGMSPHSAGMNGLAHRGFDNVDYSRHLAQFLSRNGFETVLCGMQHEAPQAEMIGYDKILDRDEEVIKDLPNARCAARYVKENKRGKPFFLSYGMEYTHREFPEIDDEIDPDYVSPPFPVNDNPATREDMAAFLTSAQLADECVGIVFKALEEAGLTDQTLIFYTTDHGLAFPGMKCTLYDGGIGVSLIMKYPENKRKGQAVDTLISQLDIFPTICDMFGLKKPDWLEGNSMLPLLEEETDKIRDELFAEVTYHAAYEPLRSIRTERYKLIKFYDGHNQVVPANIDDSLSKDFLLDNGYLNEIREKEMLFDLYFDPVERVNLVHDERYKDLYEELNIRLEEWMKMTDDPLLNGKVQKPQRAKVNKLSCISPETDCFE